MKVILKHETHLTTFHLINNNTALSLCAQLRRAFWGDPAVRAIKYFTSRRGRIASANSTRRCSFNPLYWGWDTHESNVAFNVTVDSLSYSSMCNLKERSLRCVCVKRNLYVMPCVRSCRMGLWWFFLILKVKFSHRHFYSSELCQLWSCVNWVIKWLWEAAQIVFWREIDGKCLHYMLYISLEIRLLNSAPNSTFLTGPECKKQRCLLEQGLRWAKSETTSYKHHSRCRFKSMSFFPRY